MARPTPAEWVTQTASATQKPLTVRGFTHERHVVGGEGEQPVDALGHRRGAGERQQLLGLLPGLVEVARGERQHRRHDLGFGRRRGCLRRGSASVGVRSSRCRSGRNAPGSTGPGPGDAGSAAPPRARPGDRRHRGGPRQLVGQRRQRQRHADLGRDLRPPDPRAAHDDVGRDIAVVGAHPTTWSPAVRYRPPRAGRGRATRSPGASQLRVDPAHGLGDAVGGRCTARRAPAPGPAGDTDARPPPRRQTSARTPAARSQPWRRCSSAARSGVVATSSPPTGRKAGPSAPDSADNFSTV